MSFSQCNLHIHGEHSRRNRIVPMLALSEPTAIGLVIAHGNETVCLFLLQLWQHLDMLGNLFWLLSYNYVCDLLSSPGTVGDSLSSSQHPDVFVSSDGGYNWRGTLRGPHHYSILDSGGLIVAVETRREGQVKTIKYWADPLTLCPLKPVLFSLLGQNVLTFAIFSCYQVLHRRGTVLEVV